MSSLMSFHYEALGGCIAWSTCECICAEYYGVSDWGDRSQEAGVQGLGFKVEGLGFKV